MKTQRVRGHEFVLPLPIPANSWVFKTRIKINILINMSHNIINWIYSNWNKLHVTNFKLQLVITCSFYASLLMYWLSFTWWIIFYIDVSGYGKPVGYRNPYGYGFGQNFIPVMGMGFLAGVFFLREYGFGQVIPSGFLPIVISRCIGGLTAQTPQATAWAASPPQRST
jgi:hypothetical protein